mgnify:CR=1 FL=1
MRNNIENEILNLANEFTLLPKEDYENIKMFINNNEAGEAFETLCSQLFEKDIKISLQTYNTIEKIGISIGMSDSSWAYLQRSIIS